MGGARPGIRLRMRYAMPLLAAASFSAAIVVAPTVAANPECVVVVDPNLTHCANPGNTEIHTSPIIRIPYPYPIEDPWGIPDDGGLTIGGIGCR